MKLLENLKLNKKFLKEFDYITIIAVICIVLLGCVTIYSATYNVYGNHYFKMQGIFLILGLIMVYLFLVFDYGVVYTYRPKVQ